MPKTSTSTPSPSPIALALQGVPDAFRGRLVEAYLALKSAAREARYDVAGLNSGKFCEVCLRLLQHRILGTSTAFGTPLPNFADECRKLITASAPTVPESLRAIVPRALVFLYTIRSKRGIGHVGGDVDPNEIDLATSVRVADWVVCELIRVYHSLSLEEAQDLVDGLSIRSIPEIWEVGGKKRVLRHGLSAAEQTLLLLYTDPTSAHLAEDVCQWVEYSSLRDFRTRVLRPLHKARLIEFDEELQSIQLSPLGSSRAEAILRTAT